MSLDFYGLVEEPAPAPPAPPAPPPEPWNQWFKTDNTNLSGLVQDDYAWIQNLPALGFTGNIGRDATRGEQMDGKPGFKFTPEAQKEIDRLKGLGYNFLYNPNTHNNYEVAVTPQGTYKLNTEGTSFLQGIAPVLGVLAAPLTGGLSAALGGGAAGTIAANALVQGGLGAITGQDPLQSALRGAVTSGIGAITNPIASSIGADVLNATDSKFLSDIVSGAVKGVPGALLSGDASNLLTGAVTGAVGSQVGDQLGLTPKQSQVAMGLATKLLQGGDLTPADLMRIGTSFGGAKPTASQTTGGYGGAETSGMFDPDVEAGLLYYGSDPDQEKYIDEDRLLARYPAPTVEDVRTTMSPMELNKFLEANIEDPGTIETLMQEYFPELYRQQIEVVGNRPATELFPEFDQPLLTAPAPSAAPAPASATTPGQSPAPSPAPSAAPKAQSGFDPRLFAFLMGMAGQDKEKPDPYQVAQINARSPFGTIYDQQQDLLGLMGRG
jgi:hypothetical protein